MSVPAAFHPFTSPVSTLELPTQFTFPFFYEPHPIARLAAESLQQYLLTQKDWIHNFGLDDSLDSMVIGKMFGVLVVQDTMGNLGYLAAFSGKLADQNHHHFFVPPVYDMLEPDGFFVKGIVALNALNAETERLEQAPEYLQAKAELAQVKADFEQELEAAKSYMRAQKEERKLLKAKYEKLLSAEEVAPLNAYLVKQSLRDKYDLKKLNEKYQCAIAEAQVAFDQYHLPMEALKLERKTKSAALQQLIFEQYAFLNANGDTKSLFDIFEKELNMQPPAAAGECAAPKLLQYAFVHQLKPIALAEFWWGQSPKSEIRKHQHFYPACKSKCEPILTHMLQGLDVEPNPLLNYNDAVNDLPVLFEDDDLVVINKPEGFLSVPGIRIQDSVYERMKAKYPLATGPLIVHRLDMATSGILLIAKTKEMHEKLQRHFIKKTIKKRYVALLDGEIEPTEGEIILPLRVDLDDRPRQLVCYEYGKPAVTKYKVVSKARGKTRIHFWPITGRTHQLRVHAAHSLGLATPIMGDDLYGTAANRLYLHAESIEFVHPKTKQLLQLTAPAPF